MYNILDAIVGNNRNLNFKYNLSIIAILFVAIKK